VFAGPSLSNADGWREIFRTADTVFVDLDDTPTTRYYEVRALLSEGQNGPVVESQCTPSRRAMLRPPDLRWNRKLSVR